MGLWGSGGLEAHDRCSDVEECRHGALEACCMCSDMEV